MADASLETRATQLIVEGCELTEETVVRMNRTIATDLAYSFCRQHVLLYHQIGNDAGSAARYSHHAVNVYPA